MQESAQFPELTSITVADRMANILSLMFFIVKNP